MKTPFRPARLRLIESLVALGLAASCAGGDAEADSTPGSVTADAPSNGNPMGSGPGQAPALPGEPAPNQPNNPAANPTLDDPLVDPPLVGPPVDSGPAPTPDSPAPNEPEPVSTPAPSDGSDCPQGAVLCADRCSNLLIDPTNCGECGNVCPASMACVEGTCSCLAGGVACDGSCVDLQSEPSHCGACGNACGAEEICNVGECSSERSCASHLTLCGSACIDTAGSPLNCGACGQACPSGQTCQNSACRCPVGQDACNGACVPVTDDETNCGACGNVCAPEQSCIDSACECPEGQILCGDDCIDPTNDNSHCGECNNACGGNTECLSGACIDPASVRCSGGGGTSNLCNSGQSATVGKYQIVNNQWGEDTGSGSQCTQATCLQGDIVGWQSEFTWSGQANSVKAFPNIIMGWNWSDPRTAETQLPLQLSSSQNVTCGWDFTVNASGTLNVAFDMWAHNTSSPNGAEPTDEIMVWLYRDGGAGPISDGSAPQNVNIAGTGWTLHRGMTETFNVYSYVRNENATTMVLNMMDFLDDLVSRGWMSSNKYLSGVHAGSEIFTGSGTVVHNGFYCRVQ